jgi:thiamine biosynthesis lipoprotein
MSVAIRSFPAHGTTASVTVERAQALAQAVEIAERQLREIDKACSRFRDDSELSLLNRMAGRPFMAGPLLFDAVAVALRAAADTEGDVDPTVGRCLGRLGWDRDFTVVVARRASPRLQIVPAAGWRRVRVDPNRRTIWLPAGVELDLGATAKALAADRCAREVFGATSSAVLVNLGGDIAVAGPAPGDGWPILVTDDHRSPPSAEGQTIALVAGGLATSSTTVRCWPTARGEAHHIVDPRSGAPAREVWRTVSVAAGSCVAANTAATAAIVRGERARSWLEHRGLPARLVRRDGRELRTCGWPAAAAA